MQKKQAKGSIEKTGLGNILITGAPIALNRFGNFVNAAFLNYLVFSLASDAGGVIFNVRGQCMNITMALLFGAIQAGVPELGKLYGANAKERIQEWIELFRIVEREYPNMLFEFENDPPLTEEEKDLMRRLRS